MKIVMQPQTKQKKTKKSDIRRPQKKRKRFVYGVYP
jgi:hypothetical protein